MPRHVLVVGASRCGAKQLGAGFADGIGSPCLGFFIVGFATARR